MFRSPVRPLGSLSRLHAFPRSHRPSRVGGPPSPPSLRPLPSPTARSRRPRFVGSLRILSESLVHASLLSRRWRATRTRGTSRFVVEWRGSRCSINETGRTRFRSGLRFPVLPFNRPVSNPHAVPVGRGRGCPDTCPLVPFASFLSGWTWVYRTVLPVRPVKRPFDESVRKEGIKETKGSIDPKRNHVDRSATEDVHGERARVLCEARRVATRHRSRGESGLPGTGAKTAPRRGTSPPKAGSRTSVQGDRRSLRVARAETQDSARPQELRKRIRALPGQESSPCCNRGQEGRDFVGCARRHIGHSLRDGSAQSPQRTITDGTEHVEEKRTALPTRQSFPFGRKAGPGTQEKKPPRTRPSFS
eukprot:scaffold649_cov347-Pavlova_lutheri.AAC.94